MTTVTMFYHLESGEIFSVYVSNWNQTIQAWTTAYHNRDFATREPDL